MYNVLAIDYNNEISKKKHIHFLFEGLHNGGLELSHTLRKICENTGILNFEYSRIFSEYSRLRTKCGRI